MTKQQIAQLPDPVSVKAEQLDIDLPVDPSTEIMLTANEDGIGIYALIDDKSETAKVTFKCTGCGQKKLAHVPAEQVDDRKKIKTHHNCQVCNRSTDWVESGWTKIQVE